MNKLLRFVIPAIAAQLSACSSIPAQMVHATSDAARFASKTQMALPATETLLLVSLSDGSVVKQAISGSADICFKQNGKTETTCLTEGAPIIDPLTQQIIAYEMVENQIHLYPSHDGTDSTY